jgi:enoyl-CoA hydratase
MLCRADSRSALDGRRAIVKGTSMNATVSTRAEGRVTVVTIERPERRNAVDFATARALFDAFKRFDADPDADVAVLTGSGGAFCAGFDLKALGGSERNLIETDGEFGPMGPTRLKLGKPVIAAIEGPAVAGGMELALWCDLRIAGRSAMLGVFNRRFGVPLVDLGTIRLPRIVGQGRALELILTGRPVGADEALRIGLVNEVTADGAALTRAIALAQTLCGFPQTAMRNDRLAAIEQWDLGGPAAVANEVARGLATLASGETAAGLARFRDGAGRHGAAVAPSDADRGRRS